MSTPVVRFDRVSKRFLLRRTTPRSFQEVALGLIRKRARRDRGKEAFWALRDVSFEIAPNEAVGIVGSNGAGKSTALKLISRIIEPTSGSIEARGRIGALLELGAGFHPELTGRENIFLNGSILGLGRSQLRDRLGDIIAFAELERFIDVPVKHYSSGMYVRLGFSVAAHTDPDLLLIDEVLAVGDVAFQRKCLDRVNEMRRKGVTVLLVSHDLDAVRANCARAIWLQAGQVAADGPTEAVIQGYLKDMYSRDTAVEGRDRRWGSGPVRIVQVRLADGKGQQRETYITGEQLVVEISYMACKRVEQPVFGLAIHRADGVHVTGPNTGLAGLEIPHIEGTGVVRYELPCLRLLEGTYYVSVSIHNRQDTEMFDYHDRLYSFRVLTDGAERYGVVSLGGEWSWKRAPV